MASECLLIDDLAWSSSYSERQCSRRCSCPSGLPRPASSTSVHYFMLVIWISVICSTIKEVRAGRRCEEYGINCEHGTCVPATLPMSTVANATMSPGSVDANKTPKAICMCDDLWSGPSCNVFTCFGRMALSAPSGEIIDATGNYTTDNKCTWLIEGNGLPVRLNFKEFVTECCWDHLYVFDGSSVYDPIIAVYSGMIKTSGSLTQSSIPELTANSGSAYLYFYSDVAVNMSGFKIEYSFSECPANCSGNGECFQNGTCSCSDGWKGKSCNQPSCPNNCTFPNGDCILNANCVCHYNYRGYDCSVPSSEGFWTELTSDADASRPDAVTSHATVVLADRLWVLCGYSFVPSDNCSTLVTYDFLAESWDTVTTTSSSSPSSRYGHSAIVYENNIYMYGGVSGKTISDEFWMLNLTSLEWSLIISFGNETENVSAPLAVSGHSSVGVNDSMYVFFGHNPVYGYLNIVQRYDFTTNTWSFVNTTGAVVKGGYGHTSVYDNVTNVVLVHGGFLSQTSSTYLLTDGLYAFNVTSSSWLVLAPSMRSRYLHSSVILGRLMLVFGGNTHNDSTVSQATQCYSSNFMAYDLECNQWSSLKEPVLPDSIARYGHSSFVYDSKMYVFGGFNGLVLDDMFVYEPGTCRSYSTEVSCLSSREGIRCVWANNMTCLTPEEAETQFGIHSVKSATCASESIDVAGICKKERYPMCQSCTVNSLNCEWCSAECHAPGGGCSSLQQKATSEAECLASFMQYSVPCIYLHNCQACHLDPRCLWSTREHKCEVMSPTSGIDRPQCELPCNSYNSCENCTSASCMWCSSWPPRCVESNSYVASFPYGQCMEWTTVKAKCSATRCAELRSCFSCLLNPACGWCDDGSNTGVGMCVEGGRHGPIVAPLSTVSRPFTCPDNQWHFTSCPMCQCNGHSQCIANTSQCIECQDSTTGIHCEQCLDGYWGQPLSGGNCTECQCNGGADYCNPDNGVCYCNTRGVTGDHCTVCDTAHKYYGDPLTSACYYELAIDYVFTFNMSYEENKYYTHINFLNTPPLADKDVEFNINCTGRASMNMTVKSAGDLFERPVVSLDQCTVFKRVFKFNEYNFGGNSNTTFYVYVYNFHTPFLLQLYFYQSDHLDLFRFFVTFFSCFFSLLLIAFVAWKLRQRYDIYRRGQRHLQEMAAMASRPFATCIVDVTANQPLIVPTIGVGRPDIRTSTNRKKDCKCSPIALEPLFGHKAAILTAVIRLPTGDEDYTPPDQCGIAIGSALVTLGNHSRRSSLERSKADRNSKRQKLSNSSRPSCASIPVTSPTAVPTSTLTLEADHPADTVQSRGAVISSSGPNSVPIV